MYTFVGVLADHFFLWKLSLLTLVLGLVFVRWQLRRHAQQLQEIEHGLEELREFEHPSR